MTTSSLAPGSVAISVSGKVSASRIRVARVPPLLAARSRSSVPRAIAFSGGEGLAFILQERHRAEIVGEVTAGAANAGRPYRINARSSVTIPNGQIRSAVGGGNREGTGVTPDVKTPAVDALKIAHARALRGLLDREVAGP
jgi:hypothetical protein